ncbi:SGNH/GDSL hydrolase family protein [Chitinolyticbacter meiyuanensis]|uniref:SGNH/GDSL hydrolase family protein n=1 Tax=Chitinolyticbacter meiyuanensis TaxID=682798 RepID=UPI0016523ED5|nr:SGNH/GDSL hydrolase family protein [Chitinolyticbacter meiyuanensis]
MSYTMRVRRPLAALMTTLLLVACGGGGGSTENVVPTTPGQAAGYTQIVAFGDSLTDSGTYNPTTADADPSNDVPVGLMFTTKPGGTWASYIAVALGLPLTPNQQVNFGVVGHGGQVFQLGGLNYAEGGAMLLVDAANGGVNPQPVPGLGTVPVQTQTARAVATQISDYLAEHGNAFNANQLVLIQGGANDLFAFLRQVAGNPSLAANAPTVISNTVTAMVTQIQRLKAAGATHIVYANLPDLGATPQFRGTALAGLATTLSTNYNAAVKSTLTSSNSGVVIFDTQALISQAIASPASFGFVNVTTPACTSYTTPGDATTVSALICSANTLVAAGADQSYLFADGVHPTARGHQIWAAKAVELILSGS